LANKYQDWLNANPDKVGTEDYILVEEAAQKINVDNTEEVTPPPPVEVTATPPVEVTATPPVEVTATPPVEVTAAQNKYQNWLNANSDKVGTEDYILVEERANNKYQKWLDANPNKVGTEDYNLVENAAKGITQTQTQTSKEKELEEGSDAVRGVSQYINQMGGLWGAGKVYFGMLTDSPDMITSGLNSMESSEAAVLERGVKETDSFTKAIDQGAVAVLTEWLPYMVGQGVGVTAEMVLTAFVGGLIGAGGGALYGSVVPGAGTVVGGITGGTTGILGGLVA